MVNFRNKKKTNILKKLQYIAIVPNPIQDLHGQARKTLSKLTKSLPYPETVNEM